MKIRTIDWKNNKVRLIDQTKLPEELVYLNIDNLKDLWQAIKILQVRGAPALGAASALGVYLGVRDYKGSDWPGFKRRLDKVAQYIASARPTARNLFWGIERIAAVALKNKTCSISRIKQIILTEAKIIMQEDMVSCRKIGFYGAKLLHDFDTVLTICNAGILATIDYGTALGVIYSAVAEGKRIKVYSSETRPLLQGARLSTWELNKQGVDVRMIADNSAAKLMQEKKIDLVIAGADRIAANGDSANKIGTLNLAVLCKFHKIPFYIAAPFSTFDLEIKSGKDIAIEMRDPDEVTKIMFKREVAPQGAKVLNPAFDVTNHELISAIITDRGIIRAPYPENIKKILKVERCA
ncbi:MAG: S-methyl-5-thioribose-1-phosphate isomerase [Candidatus Omnitrophica bacterium]|jgi:methylthioribose-1-phosphate isomerase|nr:S-methyl-5-thioribose-1-phosphate isomerase [Candidatus Omnitrophota bacterium]